MTNDQVPVRYASTGNVVKRWLRDDDGEGRALGGVGQSQARPVAEERLAGPIAQTAEFSAASILSIRKEQCGRLRLSDAIPQDVDRLRR